MNKPSSFLLLITHQKYIIYLSTKFFIFLKIIDECATNGTHDCHTNANCINNNGSYNCICTDGFTGNGTFCKGTVAFTHPPQSHPNHKTLYLFLVVAICSLWESRMLVPNYKFNSQWKFFKDFTEAHMLWLVIDEHVASLNSWIIFDQQPHIFNVVNLQALHRSIIFMTLYRNYRYWICNVILFRYKWMCRQWHQ